MITEPPIDELLRRVPSKYALVILASKRARQLTAYHHALGAGAADASSPPPQIETSSRNHLTTALEELAAGKLDWDDPAAAA